MQPRIASFGSASCARSISAMGAAQYPTASRSSSAARRRDPLRPSRCACRRSRARGTPGLTSLRAQGL